jgi:hypothetical protein
MDFWFGRTLMDGVWVVHLDVSFLACDIQQGAIRGLAGVV